MDNATSVADIPVEEILGGADYLRNHRPTAAIYLLISGTACIIGSLGNTFVLGAVAVYKPLRHVRNMFVVNLAIADLMVTSFADPMGILGMVYGSQWFTDRLAVCDLVATVCLIACVTALFSIGGDGFSRYFHICHHEVYRKVFTLRNNILLCISFWLVGVGMSLPPLLGWTYNVYDPKYLECIWNRRYSLSYTVFFSTCVVAMPVCVIAVSYVNIYLHVTASRKRLQEGKLTVATTQKETNGRSDPKNKSADLSLRLAKSLFIVFIGFVSCWTPYALLVVIDFNDNFPDEVHLFILLLAHMHSTLNFIIYALTNAQFRKGYMALLVFLFPCCRGFLAASVSPSENEVSMSINKSGTLTGPTKSTPT